MGTMNSKKLWASVYTQENRFQQKCGSSLQEHDGKFTDPTQYISNCSAAPHGPVRENNGESIRSMQTPRPANEIVANTGVRHADAPPVALLLPRLQALGPALAAALRAHVGAS